MSENLERLKAITGMLPRFPSVCSENRGCIEHKMARGTAMMFPLLKTDETFVAYNFASKGTDFPRHAHGQREWLIVYIGTMALEINGGTKVLKAGDYVCLEPDVPHRASFITDCWYHCVTVPGSPEWPDPE